jgi:hypothetical protein
MFPERWMDSVLKKEKKKIVLLHLHKVMYISPLSAVLAAEP